MTRLGEPAVAIARPAERIAGAVIAGIALAAAAAIVMYITQGGFFAGADFLVYHQTGASVLHGVTPYDFTNQYGLQFIYSPFAALVFTPLGFLGARMALAVWTFLSVVALEVVVWLTLGKLRSRRGMLTVVITLAALPIYPVFTNLGLGQVNILLMLLVFADLMVLRNTRWAGIGIGLAAGIKLTPLVFLPYLLATRRYRAAGVSVGTFAATIGLGFLTLPGPSTRYWGGLFLDTNRMTPDGSAPYNDSLSAVLGRLFGHTDHGGPVWLALSVLIGLAGLVVAVVAARRGDELTGVLACAVVGLLVSPVSWPPHWVWCVPLFVVWGYRAWRDRSGVEKVGIGLVWVVLAGDSAWSYLSLLGYPTPTGLGGELLSDLLVFLGIAFLVSLAVVLWRRSSEGTAQLHPLTNRRSAG